MQDKDVIKGMELIAQRVRTWRQRRSATPAQRLLDDCLHLLDPYADALEATGDSAFGNDQEYDQQFDPETKATINKPRPPARRDAAAAAARPPREAVRMVQVRTAGVLCARMLLSHIVCARRRHAAGVQAQLCREQQVCRHTCQTCMRATQHPMAHGAGASCGRVLCARINLSRIACVKECVGC